MARIKRQTDVYKYGRKLIGKGLSRAQIKAWCLAHTKMRLNYIDSLLDELYEHIEEEM